MIEFEGASDEPSWIAVNDSVMGGISEGGPRIQNGRLLFSGVLSLENNGGFASTRSINRRFDFSEEQGVRLRVRGDGRTYQFRLATNARFRGSRIAYQVEFETRADEWIEVQLPFSSFRPGWRGRMLRGPELELSEIFELGILLGDGNPGPFKLEVDWIRPY